MTCQEFLSSHSDLLDGRLAEDAAAGIRAHLEGCRRCSRHHDLVSRSLALLSELPFVEPSSDFQDRLQHRVLHLQDEMARHDRFAGSGTMASLAIAAVIALVAWGPLMWPGGVREIDARAGASEQTASAAAGARDMTPVEWYGAAPGMRVLDGPLSMSVAFPGPYSPLIVEAPVTRASGRAARAVFAAYYPGVE